MEKRTYQSLQELPLMLSMMDVASVLGISKAGAYASMDRRERYLEERDNDDKPLSVDALLEEGYSEATLCSSENPEDMIADKLLVKRLNTVLETLNPTDREMIHAVFFDGLSMREYAKRLGVYPRAVVYRMERLLKMLRKML